ncbi:MAG: pimeloyl-ACP methyl ester carboxylesterase [Bacteroidia bacterium]
MRKRQSISTAFFIYVVFCLFNFWKLNVVLLPGFCESKQLWETQIDKLSEEHNLLVLDLPGFGEFSNIDGLHSMNEAAVYVLKCMDDAAMEKAVVLGHSMGGYIALEMLFKAPERLLGIGLIHAHAQADSEEKIMNRTRTIKLIKSVGSDSFLKMFRASLLSNQNLGNMNCVEWVKKIIVNPNPQAIISYSTAMMNRENRLECIAHANKPVLFVLGKHDKIIPTKLVLDQASLIDGAMIHLLTHSGHISQLEEPEECLTAIMGFLNEVSAV